MTKIRLRRKGRSKQPSYDVVVTDSKARRNSNWIEHLGYYDPIAKFYNIDKIRFDYWVKIGAQLTDGMEKIINSLPNTRVQVQN